MSLSTSVLLLVALAALAVISFAQLAEAAPAKVVTYPAPQGQPMSQDYPVAVDGKPVDVYIAPTWKHSYGPPFGGPYSFASFDLSGQAEVRITTDKPRENVIFKDGR